MDVYWIFFKLLVSTIVTFVEAAMLLFAPASASREPAPRVAPRLVHAAAPLPSGPDVRALMAKLTSTDAGERARAACTLADMEAAARPAVPALANLLGDATRVDARVCDNGRHGVRKEDATTTPGESAAAALASIGEPSVDPLIASLRSPEWFARKNAVWALGAIEDARAVPSMIAVLRDPEAPVRRNAAWALGAIESKSAVVPLTEALKDLDAETRANAAWALGAIEDTRAVDALGRALVGDNDSNVRQKAAWALGAIENAGAVDVLGRALLSDSDKQVRANAAWALGAIGEPRAAEALAAALKDRDAEVRRHAAWALGAIQR